MKIIDAWPMAFDSLKANKMRSGLTILGVVIGVAAVIILVSLGEGAKGYILGRIQGFGLGANTIVVSPGKTGNPSEPSKLTDSDVAKISTRVKNVVEVGSEIEASGKFEFGKQNRYPYVVGVTANYLTIVNFRV